MDDWSTGTGGGRGGGDRRCGFTWGWEEGEAMGMGGRIGSSFDIGNEMSLN